MGGKVSFPEAKSRPLPPKDFEVSLLLFVWYLLTTRHAELVEILWCMCGGWLVVSAAQ